MPSFFFVSDQPSPHAERTRLLLAEHPEARGLIGPNPWTFGVAVGVVVLQVLIAALIGQLDTGRWWLALVIAWCIGAFASHTLYVIIHEATHDLIFKRRWLNRGVAIFADLPNVFPAAMGFRVYHLKHHAHQGEIDQDIDLPGRWEAKVFGGNPLGKALWLLLFPLMQLLRLRRVAGFVLLDRWSLAAQLASICFASAVYFFFGGLSLLYLFASFWFSVGLHPLGGRWIQEHYTCDAQQETASYYGPLNMIALNVGYHNEHHDLPSVAWNNLPRLRSTAPELYDSLRSHGSWSRLVLQFIFDKQYSLFSRVVREKPGAA